MTLQPRDVTDEPWFKDLYREQHNFSLGLNAVRNQAAIDALEEIVSSGRTAAPANPDGPAETEGAPGPDLAVTEDSRTRAMHAITERQGRGRFREAALAAYKHQCAISSYDADEALEAAHISAYMGPHTDRLDNTLLLRADLHTLFDRHLMAIDTTTWKVIIAQDLMHTTYYREFHGERVRLPDREADRPRAEYLDEHRRKANL